MIGEIGQLALCLALALSLVQAFAGFRGGIRGDARLIAVSRSATFGVFVFVALSFGALTWAYVSSDFSILAVAQNSHTTKPLLYKITGVWGNHEGSMLLWVLILSVYSVAMAMTGTGGERLGARALGIQALIAIAFILFILLTSNPFLRLFPQPFEGAGLNPLLQDPGLAFHPPMLYLGYVGLSATFAYAAAALMDVRYSTASSETGWVRAARPFVLTAWTTLTLGVAGGSWWAYYTLGWGGFWFWDPVENASLMPWLVATALVHSMMATERSGAFKSWTLLLAITAFSFSLIGTFLVRSGLLNSVHAFANDPERGVFILAILVMSIGGSLILFAWAAPKFSSGAPFEPASRETAILLNNLLLAGATATVFIGTLYPLALDAFTGAKISVGPPYFTVTFVPLAVVLMVLMPFGPISAWRRTDLYGAAYTLRWAFGAGILAMIAALALASPFSLLGSLGIGLGVWLICGAGTDLVRRARRNPSRVVSLPVGAWAGALAHAGIGVVAIGIAGASVWKSETIQVLAPGETMTLAGYTLRLDGTERITGPNYIADRATITVFSGDDIVTVMNPEKRQFPVEGNVTTQAAIRTTILADLYVVLGDEREGGAWVVRAYVNPLAPLMWLGAVVMALGGLFAIAVRLRGTRPVRTPAPGGVAANRTPRGVTANVRTKRSAPGGARGASP